MNQLDSTHPAHATHSDGPCSPLLILCRVCCCRALNSGGLAKPATLECNIGPGDYDPRTGDLGDVLSHRGATGPGGSVTAAPGPGFGSSPRFLKAGVQYLGAEHARSNVGHASPGPKYLISTMDTAAAVANSTKAQRSALKWVP